MTELELQAQVADYLRLQYPSVLFHSDFGLTSLAVQLRRTENLLRQISDLVTEENIKAVAEEQIDAKEQA